MEGGAGAAQQLLGLLRAGEGGGGGPGTRGRELGLCRGKAQQLGRGAVLSGMVSGASSRPPCLKWSCSLPGACP